MDAQLKAKWVEALRSGKYGQARGRLEEDGAFCCLGVLCKVADLPLDEDLAYGRFRTVIKHDYTNLTAMNDDGSSFAAIADYIEANL